MQQIKLRNNLKKKSLTIESIRVELFEKNQNTLSRKLATISTTQQDRIFTPSKRHLTPIFPSNQLSQKTAQSIGLEKIDNSKIGRWIIREKEQLRNIRRYFSMNKQFKKLSHNLSHSVNLCKQEIRKAQEWGKVQEHKYVQIKKSISLKVQKIHRQKTENIERIFNPKFRKQNFYKRESLLLPLRASVDLQNHKDIFQSRNPKVIEVMEAKLLENSNRSKYFRKILKEKRETHISPWRVENLKETQAQFPN